MKEFLAMGGYGFYVWSSYAIAMLILIAHFIAGKTCLNKTKAMIKRRLRRENKV